MSKESLKKCYGIVKNKKFKYYKDKTLKKRYGVFDFDRIQCVIVIVDKNGGGLDTLNSSRQSIDLKDNEWNQ